MLQPAHVGHLAMLRSLIRQGAEDGSFDRDLAADSPAAEEFFAKLKRALVTGYFVEESAPASSPPSPSPATCSGRTIATAGSPPVGFGLFRSIDGTGYELWLAGLDLAARGGGQGRAVAGVAVRNTSRARRRRSFACSATSRYVNGLQSLLVDFGFNSIGDTLRLRWFLHKDAPAALASRVRDAVDARIAVN